MTSARSAAALPKAMFMSSCRISISSLETSPDGSGAMAGPLLEFQPRLGAGQDRAHALPGGRLPEDLHRSEIERSMEGPDLGVCREDDDQCLGARRPDVGQAGEPVHPGHGEIEE